MLRTNGDDADDDRGDDAQHHHQHHDADRLGHDPHRPGGRDDLLEVGRRAGPAVLDLEAAGRRAAPGVARRALASGGLVSGREAAAAAPRAQPRPAAAGRGPGGRPPAASARGAAPRPACHGRPGRSGRRPRRPRRASMAASRSLSRARRSGVLTGGTLAARAGRRPGFAGNARPPTGSNDRPREVPVAAARSRRRCQTSPARQASTQASTSCGCVDHHAELVRLRAARGWRAATPAARPA